MWNASVVQQYLDFWLAKMWKNCCFVMCVICLPRRLVGGDPDPCKGLPVYSRLISTSVFHLHHERDGDVQQILIALLLKLSLLRRATWRCGLTFTEASARMCFLLFTVITTVLNAVCSVHTWYDGFLWSSNLYYTAVLSTRVSNSQLDATTEQNADLNPEWLKLRPHYM